MISPPLPSPTCTVSWCALRVALVVAVLGLTPGGVLGDFDLQFTIVDSLDRFTSEQELILQDALDLAETMWEGVIVGYPDGVEVESVDITVIPGSALADASVTGTSLQGGFRFVTSGRIRMNPDQIEPFSTGIDPGGNFNTGLNYMDELMAHEVGHVLGVGTLWDYVNGSFEFTGASALAAYQAEFDADATFVPVENAGSSGTMNSHWDQLMRSSPQEGDPSDPWSLSPLVDVVDPLGRDRGLELMTGAIDPDYGEPFLSITTIQVMRDMGYTVTSPEDFNGDAHVDGDDLDVWQANFGATGLEIDSHTFGDAWRDRNVDGADFLNWQRNISGAAMGQPVPEPSPYALAAAAALLVVALGRRPRRRL